MIERFINTGEPVGSKFLAATLPVSCSPATIRNEMAFLAENGFLDQPHTSAGRIPSDKGYRYYIEKLLSNFTPSSVDMFRILSEIDHSEGDTNEILSQTCSLLARLSGCAAAAMTPDTKGAVIRSTQVIPMSRRKALVVVSTSSGVIKNRIARLENDIDYPLMELFYNTVAANFTDLPAEEISAATLQTVLASLGEKSLELAPLLISFYECALACCESGVIVRGQSNLLNSADLHAAAADMIELLNDGDAAWNLLQLRSDSPVELKIGTENEYSCMRRAAVIKTEYRIGDIPGGTIALIGPTKMDYSRNIPLLKYIAGVAGSLLTEAAAT